MIKTSVFFLIAAFAFNAMSMVDAVNSLHRSIGPVGIITECGDKCVANWRTCPCGPLLNGCTTEDSYGRAWCATEVDPVTRVYINWDWCDTLENCTCITESKQSCFEFTYMGESYSTGTCIYMDSPSGKPWCATEPNVTMIEGPSGGSKSNWDFCNENCGIAPPVCEPCDCEEYTGA